MTDVIAAAEALKTDSIAGYSTYIWGILGAAVSMRFVPQLGFWQKLTAIASGATMAVAGTPIAKYTFGLHDEQILYGVSFFIGVFGLSITASIFDTIKNTKWGRIIESRFGNPNSDVTYQEEKAP